MRSTSKSLAIAGLIVGLSVSGTVIPASAQNTGSDLTPISASRTVETQAVELQRILASVRAKGRVLKRAASLLVTAEVPGETTGIEKRTRLGLPTWRVVVEMESGYKVAAFVHRRTGVIIDWVVLKVPADVEYTPPKKDTKRPDLDPTKPKPAPVPAIVEDAIEAERQAASPAVAPPTPASTSVPSSGSGSDDDSREDSSDDSRDDSDDDSRDDSSDDSRDDSSDDSRDDSREDSDDDSRDDRRDSDSADDSKEDSPDPDDSDSGDDDD